MWVLNESNDMPLVPSPTNEEDHWILEKSQVLGSSSKKPFALKTLSVINHHVLPIKL